MRYFFKAKQLKAGTNKRFWGLWLPLSLIGGVAIYFAFSLLEAVVADRLDRKIFNSSELVKKQMKDSLQGIYVDLDFIEESQSTQAVLLDSSSEVPRSRLNSLFLTLSGTHKAYDQIRLLSSEGKELARVNYNSGKPTIIQPEQLQDKSDRYYFQEAIKQPIGRAYVSPLDLNVEDGHVERPYKPVIRFAKAIRDENGEVKGVVVLNYLAEILLDNYRGILSAIPGQRMLLNSDGYWLSSDVRAKEWGFMLGTGHAFSHDFPELWSGMAELNQGVLESHQGRVNFFTLQPLVSEKLQEAPEWKMVVVNTDHRLGISFLFEHLAYLYPLLLAYPLGSILLWFWARADSGREIAEKELKALNKLLEEKVKKRTVELEATKDAAILSLATLAETRDNETGQHIRRTQYYMQALATELRQYPEFRGLLTDQSIQQIFKSAPLHDIGKVGIPDSILLKAGKLSDDEMHIMKTHTTLGSDAIEEAINSLSSSLAIDGTGTYLHYARDIAHYHHERWDGKGYPKGLHGDSIPLHARMMALADVYDALVNERVYKEAFSREKTEDIILNQSEGQFDPRVIEAFIKIKDQFWEIKTKYSD